jgi:hypothetical protein
MAGNKQHILPRFLLKGFASRVEGEKIFTWLYTRNRTPIEANIRKVSVEKHFYGRQGELSVDDNITELEGKYAPLLDELRVNEGQVEISDPRIPEFITHLVIRTKHIRDSYRKSFEYLSEKIEEYFSDFDNIKSAILNNPQLMRENIEKGFEDYPNLKPYRTILEPFAPYMALAYLFDHEKELENICRSFFENITQNILPKAMKKGHITALSQGLIPDVRAEMYRQLRWFVFNCNEAVILGDIGCLFEITGEKRFNSINFQNDIILNIFLPISDGKILVGTSFSGIPNVDLNLINLEIAKCSRDFFICSKKSSNIITLLPKLGKDVEIMTRNEIEEAVKELFQEYKPGWNRRN